MKWLQVLWQPFRTFRTSSAVEMQKMVRRDKRRRKCVTENAQDLLKLKAMLKFYRNPELAKYQTDFPRDAHISRVRNRCALTGRGRSVLRDFKLSRLKFRQIADQGLIPGVTRSSW